MNTPGAKMEGYAEQLSGSGACADAYESMSLRDEVMNGHCSHSKGKM